VVKQGRQSGGSGLLLVVDVGNTTTVFGVWDGETLVRSFRLSTDPERTSDEYGAILATLFDRAGLDLERVDGIAISSVVPPLQPTLSRLARESFDLRPLFVEPGVRTGMPIRYDHPAEVGADRIVNSVAARDLYGAPVVVVDFGTATTFDVVNAAGEYAGGIIAPGLQISADALFAHASRLYQVDIQRPEHLVGRTTAGAMQSGIFYGYVGLVDGILERLKAEVAGIERVVATGGQAELIASGCRSIDLVEPLLTLIGLRRIHELNRRA